MEKLDRLRWEAGLAIEAFGVRVGIRANHARALECVRSLLPPGWKLARTPVVEHLYSLILQEAQAEGRVRRYHLVYSGITRLARTFDLEEALRFFELDLHFYIAEAAPRHIFVHAGVVGWRGRALLLPGPRGSGKSHLVAALVRAGASYLSDRFAVLDRRGRVHPYPVPIELARSTDGKLEKHAAEDLGGETARRSLPIGLIVFTRYRAGARWRPRELSPGEAGVELLRHVFSTAWMPQFVLGTLGALVERVPVMKSARGEAEEVAHALLALLEEVR
ncbi:MAG: hypothetical protein N2443_09175 [Blastocatellia bacterium]|nr:hypothetical protein [Blastocatellia bacterium]MDW8168546.1 hypothetical protein [Acidobacteriota bacterium]